MNTSDYESKLWELLSSSYKPISKKPLNTIIRLVTKAIKSSSLDPTIQKKLIPHNPKTPNIYGQTKIPKRYITLIPIVNVIGPPLIPFPPIWLWN
jgi:hypothetical protein